MSYKLYLLNSWSANVYQKCGIRWMSWDKLSSHKSHEGMGFTDLASFNVVMLDSLVERLFKTRYFAHIDFFRSKIGINLSHL